VGQLKSYTIKLKAEQTGHNSLSVLLLFRPYELPPHKKLKNQYLDFVKYFI
jgi:hypothetical protein